MIAAPVQCDIDGISKGSHSTVAANAQEGIVWGGGSAQLFNLTVTGSTLGYGIVPEPMGSVYLKNSIVASNEFDCGAGAPNAW